MNELNDIEKNIVNVIKNDDKIEINNLFLDIVENNLVKKIYPEKLKKHINNSKYIDYLEIYWYVNSKDDIKYMKYVIKKIDFDTDRKNNFFFSNYLLSILYQYSGNKTLAIKYLKLYPSFKTYLKLINFYPKCEKYYIKKCLFLNRYSEKYCIYIDYHLYLLRHKKNKYKYYCKKWFLLGGTIIKFPRRINIYLKKIIIKHSEYLRIIIKRYQFMDLINKIDYILFILKIYKK